MVDQRMVVMERGKCPTPCEKGWQNFQEGTVCRGGGSARNSLPIDIRDCSSEATFKKHLKTFLFHVAFN